VKDDVRIEYTETTDQTRSLTSAEVNNFRYIAQVTISISQCSLNKSCIKP
jgi:hypothetical protein